MVHLIFSDGSLSRKWLVSMEFGQISNDLSPKIIILCQTVLATQKDLILIEMIWLKIQLVSAIATDELTMEPCCALKYYPAVDACQSEKVWSLCLFHYSCQHSCKSEKGFCHCSFSQHLSHHCLRYHSYHVLHYLIRIFRFLEYQMYCEGWLIWY